MSSLVFLRALFCEGGAFSFKENEIDEKMKRKAIQEQAGAL